MKKLVLISLIMLIAVSAFSQATGRTGYRSSGDKEKEKQKKEAVKKDTEKNSGNTVSPSSTERRSSRSRSTENKSSNTNNNSATQQQKNPRNGTDQNKPNVDNGGVRRNPNSNRKMNDKPINEPVRSSGNNSERRRTETQGTNGVTNENSVDNTHGVSTNEDRFKPSNGNPNRNASDGNRRYVYKNENDGTTEHGSYSSNHVRHDNRQEHYYVHPYRPEAIEIRRVKYPIREPRFINIYWTTDMMYEYRSWYPEYRYWNYPIGYRLTTISAYDASNYIGEVARVYGKVEDVYYSPIDDEYYLYIGAWYPYQDMSIIIPGDIARCYAQRPSFYFNHSYISVAGFITEFDGRPEVLVKRTDQLERYYR